MLAATGMTVFLAFVFGVLVGALSLAVWWIWLITALDAGDLALTVQVLKDRIKQLTTT